MTIIENLDTYIKFINGWYGTTSNKCFIPMLILILLSLVRF